MKSTLLLAGFGLLQFSCAYPRLLVSSRAGNGTDAIAAGCAKGVHMIIARASTEAAGPGVIGGVAKSVTAAIPGSDSESVVYPATLQNYASSEGQGVAGMQKLIQAYTTKCPNSKIALMGYSQGAQVVGDILGGSSGGSQTAAKAISPDAMKNLVAVVQMGDPTHVPDQPQNVGTSKKAGKFPRKDTAALAPYAKITQSYCDTGDTFCDSGNSIQVHLSYVDNYGDKAAAFIEKQVKEAA